MKLWEIITTVRDMGGTIEDVRELIKLGATADDTAAEQVQTPVENPVETVENPVETVENCGELEALRLENAQLKGQLQTYNILHATVEHPPTVAPDVAAVQAGLDMIK